MKGSLLFDLDGTLIDTAQDMGAALNTLLENHNCVALTHDAMRIKVSQGVRGLVGLGFNIQPEDKKYPALAKEFLEIYESRNHSHSIFFEGMENLLNQFKKAGIPLGIVTNKPRYLTETLAERLNLSNWFGSIVCGDDLPLKKPHPEPLYKACDELCVDANRSVYLGDAARDIEAGNNAGMLSIVVGWGYFDVETDKIDDWQADHFAKNIQELETLLSQWKF